MKRREQEVLLNWCQMVSELMDMVQYIYPFTLHSNAKIINYTYFLPGITL
jgi:hypothetical protein